MTARRSDWQYHTGRSLATHLAACSAAVCRLWRRSRRDPTSARRPPAHALSASNRESHGVSDEFAFLPIGRGALRAHDLDSSRPRRVSHDRGNRARARDRRRRRDGGLCDLAHTQHLRALGGGMAFASDPRRGSAQWPTASSRTSDSEPASRARTGGSGQASGAGNGGRRRDRTCTYRVAQFGQ